MADGGFGRVDDVGRQCADVRVVRAGLNQQHGTIGVLAQSGGEHTAG